MKALFNELFYVSKHEKVREKAMINRLAVSVTVIITLMVILSITAYAFFSHTASSGVNTITSANYELDIVPPQGLDAQDTYVLENTTAAPVEYQFTVVKSVNSTASVGYCKLIIKTDANDPADADDVQLFYTAPIWTDAGDDPDKVENRTVKITVPSGKKIEVKFVPEWGTCAFTSFDETVDNIQFAAVSSQSTQPQTQNTPVIEQEISDETVDSNLPTADENLQGDDTKQNADDTSDTDTDVTVPDAESENTDNGNGESPADLPQE